LPKKVNWWLVTIVKSLKGINNLGNHRNLSGSSKRKAKTSRGLCLRATEAHDADNRRTLRWSKLQKGEGNQGCQMQALKEKKAKRVFTVSNG
jgi:hypothetical protein